MKPSQISRVVQILTTLQAGKIYAVDDLSKMLGTSRRTVFRELKELRAVGVPYHYDVKTGGYTIEPHFFLAPHRLEHAGSTQPASAGSQSKPPKQHGVPC